MIELFDTYLLEPFFYPFMQRALIMSFCIAVVCSIFSCFLILKGWSLMGDAVSHAVLPGIAVAYVFGIPLLFGAFAAGLFCALSIGFIKAKSRVKEDAVMGIIFSGMFALGLVMVAQIETDIHLMHVLFGNILGLSRYDLYETAIISTLTILIMVLKRKDLMLYCFDPSHAQAIGLPISVLHFGLLILLSLTIVSAMKAAGIILVVAMLITPGAIGFLLTKSFGKMMMIAICASVFSCISATLLSFHLDTATAPLIIVIQSGIFVAAFTKTIFMQNRQRKVADVL